MSEPKRYKPAIDWDITGYEVEGVSMDEVKDGKWVSYADYARLKAEVERLTKAGDAMAKLLSCCGNPQSEVRGWHAAKGVQS